MHRFFSSSELAASAALDYGLSSALHFLGRLWLSFWRPCHGIGPLLRGSLLFGWASPEMASFSQCVGFLNCYGLPTDQHRPLFNVTSKLKNVACAFGCISMVMSDFVLFDALTALSLFKSHILKLIHHLSHIPPRLVHLIWQLMDWSGSIWGRILMQLERITQ